MLILAIDTSCDETSIAISRDDSILANVLSSQISSHKEWGGVVPSLAKRKHEELFPLVLRQALKTAKVKLEDIDAFAVTRGPGLAVALEVGIKKAKELALEYNKPLIPVNHMEGHLYSAFAKNSKGIPYDKSKVTGVSTVIPAKAGISSHSVIDEIPVFASQNRDDKPTTYEVNYKFPLLCLLISGGHTELVLMMNHGQYEIIGETLDDAIGESFDKVGRMLDFGYPAGPVVEKVAEKGNENAFELPIPMKNSKDLNMSYSGLKTAAMKLVNDKLGSLNEYGDKFKDALQTSKSLNRTVVIPSLTGNPEGNDTLSQSALDSRLRGNDKAANNSLTTTIADISASFQKAAVDQVLLKTKQALEKLKSESLQIEDLIIAGGVAQNKYLRKRFKKEFSNLRIHYPNNKKLYTDNAGMIAVAAYFNAKQGKALVDTFQINRMDREPNWRIDEV